MSHSHEPRLSFAIAHHLTELAFHSILEHHRAISSIHITLTLSWHLQHQHCCSFPAEVRLRIYRYVFDGPTTYEAGTSFREYKGATRSQVQKAALLAGNKRISNETLRPFIKLLQSLYKEARRMLGQARLELVGGGIMDVLVTRETQLEIGTRYWPVVDMGGTVRTISCMADRVTHSRV